MSDTAGAFLFGVGAGLIVFAVLVFVWTRARKRRGAGPAEDAERRADLTSKIGHELRNPIMSVKGLASSGIHLYDAMSDDERLEFFRLIDAEANRLKLIADEISTALRIDAGQLRYQVREEDLGDLVQEVAWRTPSGQHAMVVEVEDGLTVPLDRTRMSEVIVHLLDNASKFSPPDAPIEVRAYRSPDGDAVVEVADRGPGIPAELREEVFGEFNEWRPPGYEETPGAGLGLFICRAHLKAMAGRIDIEDEKDTGTMLRVTLPGG
ncbi:MAG TPA: ATP-binding protein [Actinomycetota bacterium]|nr:ATP-binding protein [Actinomycetota bacterium]